MQWQQASFRDTREKDVQVRVIKFDMLPAHDWYCNLLFDEPAKHVRRSAEGIKLENWMSTTINQTSEDMMKIKHRIPIALVKHTTQLSQDRW